MPLRIRLFISFIFCVLATPIFGNGHLSAWGSISVSATVEVPFGIVPVEHLRRSQFDLPVDFPFEYLLVSPSSGVTINADGSPLAVCGRLNPITGMTSGLDLREIVSVTSAERTIILTLVYTEN